MDGRMKRLRLRFKTWRNARKLRIELAKYERRAWEDQHWRKHIKDGICIDPVLHGMDVANPAAFQQRHLAPFQKFHGQKPDMPALGKGER